MGRRKRRTSKKAHAAEHNLPTGFWQQALALLLVVVAILCLLAIFGTGGPFLEWIRMVVQLLFGWGFVLLPVIAVYLAIAIFRAEDNRLPTVVIIATILFLAEIAGLLHLFTNDPRNLELAQSGVGGGLVGFG